MSLKEDPLGGKYPELTCSWLDCKRKIIGTDQLPFGWRYLVVSQGTLFVEDNLLGADVDGILCPEHSLHLLKLLK